jgi:23S rRNA G2069 N7-methylase RlmK/C1962 C5-methylase RlmI
MNELERAWQWREARGVFSETGAVRVFHGPGEGTGARKSWAVDRFTEHSTASAQDHYWITRWEDDSSRAGSSASSDEAVTREFVGFLKTRGAASIVLLGRPEKGVPALPTVLHGTPPSGRFEVSERGARFAIQLLEARHPGLFLDHAPLRSWLRARARGWKVLNTFAYTGSLSVAAGLGKASHVTTLDLSKATVSWAEENWRLNELPSDSARFISGDVFDWLPRLKREGQVFDCVILDPPSFSRGKKGNFSTAKDLPRLHALALDLLARDGVLVTSINSANVAWNKFEADVLAAAREKKCELEILWRVDLPETFPTPLAQASERYLKGWALRIRRS